MDDKLFLIFFDKGVLAVVLLIAGYIFNRMLQVNKLKGDTVTELAKDRAEAYKKLWKGLAFIRPADDEEIKNDKIQEIKNLLVSWYHEDAGALYMSWNTARRYMLVRRALDLQPIDGTKIRKSISKLRTQLKVDCGIYSNIDALLQLPTPNK